MSASAAAVKALRSATGAGIMDAKQALSDAGGDQEKAKALLAERGLLKAAKKGEREAGEGIVHSYIHGNGRIGVLLELRCETDFVARNDDFKALANELCLQIAASHPAVVDPADAPPGSDAAETALLAQPFIKDPATTVEAVIKAAISALGENIQVARFTRYELGDAS